MLWNADAIDEGFALVIGEEFNDRVHRMFSSMRFGGQKGRKTLRKFSRM